MMTKSEYDEAGQLVECETEELGSTTYQYDLNANVIKRDDGSVTTEFEWNDKNGLIGVAVDDSTVWQSTYYPDGTRFSKTDTDGSVYYLYDGGKTIGTYDADWTRREAFGYGLGANDPIVNVQTIGTESAYCFVKDGLGNVNMVLNAQGATGGTVEYSVCGEPEAGGAFVSDIAFGAGSMKWDNDVHAYITTQLDPRAARPMRLNLLGDCMHCPTEVQVQPWQAKEETMLGAKGNATVAWPPFKSPIPGWPVILDAGDAGFGMEAGVPNGSTTVNKDGRHLNGIDWLSYVLEGHPQGQQVEAIYEYLGYMYGKNGQPISFRQWDSLHWTIPNSGGALDPKRPSEFLLKDDQRLLNPPATTPLWRDNTGLTNHINAVGYRHQRRIFEVWGLPAIARTQPVTQTNRLKNDSNLGPHLHLYLGALTLTIQGGRTWQDAAWQEKYFESGIPEIPLHIYLTGICRYGWMYAPWDSYGFNWGQFILFEYYPCMHGKGRGYSFGFCAAECHGAQAKKLGGGSGSCREALGEDKTLMFDEANHTGCLACCDVRFSESLYAYHRSHSSWGLPMDTLGNVTPEGRLSAHNPYGAPEGTYQVPWYYWPSGKPPIIGSSDHQTAYWHVLWDMQDFWYIMYDLQAKYHQDLSCVGQTPGLRPYAIGAHYCDKQERW